MLLDLVGGNGLKIAILNFNKKVEYTGGFANVVGAHEAKEALGLVVDQINNIDEYIERGVKLVPGILLYGPPGQVKHH